MADTNRASVVANDLGDFDRPGLIRLGVWGLCAFVSMVLVVIAAQSEVGVKRAAAAVAAITSPPRDPTVTIAQVLARTAESEREARRLVESMRQLTLERERMVSRLDTVEREVGDLTGSINKSVATAIQAQSAALESKTASAAPPPLQPRSAPQPPPSIAPTASTPSVTTVVTPSVVPPPPVSPQVPPPAPVATNSSHQSAVVASAMMPAVSAAPIDPRTARPVWPSFMPQPTSPIIEPSAPSSAEAEVPLPRPSPIAQLQAYAAATPRGDNMTLPPGQIPQPGRPPPPSQQPADVTNSTNGAVRPQTPAAPAAPQVAPTESVDSGEQPKVEIGIDLGPALSVARLRTRWEAFQKSHGATLNGVRPVVAIRETSPNKPVELRLVVGPLAGIDVAVQVCQSLSGSSFPCQPAVFDGQRLVTR